MSTELNHKIAALALNEMMASHCFSICAVDKAATLLGCNARISPHYEALHALHCVHWNRMPREIRELVPAMISECLVLPPQFVFEQERPLYKATLPLIHAVVVETEKPSATESTTERPLLKRIFARLAA